MIDEIALQQKQCNDAQHEHERDAKHEAAAEQSVQRELRGPQLVQRSSEISWNVRSKKGEAINQSRTFGEGLGVGEFDVARDVLQGVVTEEGQAVDILLPLA